jgi:hypothetical protein
VPKDFDNCVARGGRVRTIKMSGGRYRHVCYIDGKAHLGHVKQKKKKTGGK